MKLIINADDFGLSKSITDGIIDGILDGCITSYLGRENELNVLKEAKSIGLFNDIELIIFSDF